MNQQAKVIDYFNERPNAYAATYQAPTSEGHAFRSRKKSLLRLLGAGTGRVLDVGCGPGVMTKEIAARGWEYYGVDLSPQMVAVVRAKFANRAGINFAVGAVEKLDFPDHYFDAIVAMGLVEYLADEDAAIRELRRVLKPRGVLIVSIPNWWSPARMWDRWLLTPLARLYRFLARRGQSTKLKHREYHLGHYRRFLNQRGFAVTAWEAYNFRLIPRPFDAWFPCLSIIIALWLEHYLPSVFRFLGTGLNVKAKRQ
ncbi:MAG: class I SAM-dependent methyltransferase [Patescibacteria group bacterium]